MVPGEEPPRGACGTPCCGLECRMGICSVEEWGAWMLELGLRSPGTHFQCCHRVTYPAQGRIGWQWSLRPGCRTGLLRGAWTAAVGSRFGGTPHRDLGQEGVGGAEHDHDLTYAVQAGVVDRLSDIFYRPFRVCRGDYLVLPGEAIRAEIFLD